MSEKLLASWPPIAREAVLDAARYYYQLMSEPFPVPDVAMDQAVEWASREIVDRWRDLEDEATERWIDRWESGQLDAPMRQAIEKTYGKLRRGERGLRAGARRKSSKQLDVEIAQSLAARRGKLVS